MRWTRRCKKEVFDRKRHLDDLHLRGNVVGEGNRLTPMISEIAVHIVDRESRQASLLAKLLPPTLRIRIHHDRNEDQSSALELVERRVPFGLGPILLTVSYGDESDYDGRFIDPFFDPFFKISEGQIVARQVAAPHRRGKGRDSGEVSMRPSSSPAENIVTDP